MNKKQEKAIEHKMVFKPTITITSEDLPAIKDWKIGQEYDLKIKAKLVELEMPRHEPYMMSSEAEMFKKDEIKGRFEINSVK